MLTIKEIITALASDGRESYGKVCVVKNVNGMVCDCEPIDGDADILDVRLIADDSDEFFVLVPALNSIVVVEFITKEAAYLSMVSKVAEVKYKIGTAFYSANHEGFEIKKGSDSLKDVLKLMIEAIQQIVVLQGNNPDYIKLAQALEKLNNILR